MWQRELKQDEEELKMQGQQVVGRVGNEDAWYQKQVQYWDVRQDKRVINV